MSTTYKQAKLTTEELHEVKHLMGGGLTLLALWSLAALELGSQVVLLGAFVLICFSLFRPVLVVQIPSAVWRLAGPFLLLIIGADFLLHLPEFIPSLVRMVVLLLIYRNLAPRTKREDLQLVLLCLFCLVMSGVMTVSLLFALQILLFTPLAMALLFVICILDHGEETVVYHANWERFSWRRLSGRVWKVLDLKVLALGSVMFVIVVAVSAVLFILMPRFSIDQALPFLELKTTAMTGFSEEVRLGDVSSLQQDNSVAIRVDVPSLEAIETTPYWRMLILDRYIDGGFRVSESLKEQARDESRTVRELHMSGGVRGQSPDALWTFYMEGGISRYLSVPGDYSVLRFQVPQEIELMREPQVYRLDSVRQSVFSYQIEDMKFNARFSAGPLERDSLRNRLTSEKSEDPRYPLTLLGLDLDQPDRDHLSDLNRIIVGDRSLDVSEYSRVLTEYLWQNFSYSLQPDGRSDQNRDKAVDPVIHWLKEGTRGHCELFASAFVLLAREAGYPARMVVGFAGGSWNSVENYFVVRNRDAHAWVEIYDRKSQDWLRVDPTPGSGSSDPEAPMLGSFDLEIGWAAWVDSLRIQWYRRIVNFEQDDQIELAMSLKDMSQQFSEEFSRRVKEMLAEIKAWIAQPFSTDSFLRGSVILLLLLALFLFWRARYWVMSVLFRVLNKPKSLDPVRSQASRHLKRLKDVHGEESKLPIFSELQALRFGPEVKADQAKAVFLRARKARRRRKVDLPV